MTNRNEQHAARTQPRADHNTKQQRDTTRVEHLPARIETDELTTPVEHQRELLFGSVYAKQAVLLRESQTGHILRYDGSWLDALIIGRADPTNHYVPDIDLSAFDARQHGVSRNHACLSRRDQVLTIVDHGSLNGTYLNGVRVPPHQPRVVRDGDVLHISTIRLDIAFSE